MKKVLNTDLDSKKLATYLKKQGHETSVSGRDIEFNGEDPSQELLDSLDTLTEEGLDSEVEASESIDVLIGKHQSRVVLQSILDNESLSEDETAEVNERIAAL